MTAITRRDALLGATVAAAVAGVPAIAKSAPAVLCAAQDPVIATIDRALALRPQAYPSFDQFPEETWGKLEEELEPVRREYDDLISDVFPTPAQSLEGLRAKARLAYRICGGLRDSREPIEDMTPPADRGCARLDDEQLLWSILHDLEHLAGEG